MVTTLFYSRKGQEKQGLPAGTTRPHWGYFSESSGNADQGPLLMSGWPWLVPSVTIHYYFPLEIKVPLLTIKHGLLRNSGWMTTDASVSDEAISN